MNLLQMSFSGAVFIIAVMLLRAFAIYKLPKITFPVLWEMVFLRLLIPFSIPSVFSIYTLMNNHIAAPAFSKTGTGSFVSAIPQEQFFTQSELEQLSAGAPSPVSVRLVVCSIVWCVGAIILTTFFAISWLRCQIAFQTAFPVRHTFAEQWLKECSSKRPISIKQSDKISSPLTYGIFRPVILMPANTDWENESQLQYIFAHEYVHIRRFDAFIKLIAALVLCIHWFNPLVWIMYILLNRDIELACDESVVRHFGEASKSAYSLMLINMEARKSELLPFYSNFSKNAAEERITAIMRIKRMTPAAFILACLTVLVTAGMFATSAMAKADSNILSEKAEIATDYVIPYENADSSTEHVIPHESTDNPTDYAATHEDSDVSTGHAIIHESVAILHYEDGAPYLHDNSYEQYRQNDC
ncbi:MAG: M56 family metallopeptidase [Lachnospiraceae bacterium]|nr:M56 family metallopeptidase [Lachnospiraceae bacterium]